MMVCVHQEEAGQVAAVVSAVLEVAVAIAVGVVLPYLVVVH